MERKVSMRRAGWMEQGSQREGEEVESRVLGHVGRPWVCGCDVCVSVFCSMCVCACERLSHRAQSADLFKYPLSRARPLLFLSPLSRRPVLFSSFLSPIPSLPPPPSRWTRGVTQVAKCPSFGKFLAPSLSHLAPANPHADVMRLSGLAGL